MTNITTLLDTLTWNYTTEWPVDMVNGSHETDTLSFIITPLAVVSKSGKHHIHPETVSPVILSSETSRLVRIIFLTIFSVIGSVGNIFMISSVMVEDHLKKAGKHYSYHTHLYLEHAFVLEKQFNLHSTPIHTNSASEMQINFLYLPIKRFPFTFHFP